MQVHVGERDVDDLLRAGKEEPGAPMRLSEHETPLRHAVLAAVVSVAWSERNGISSMRRSPHLLRQ